MSDLLERALAAHGGLERWHALSEVRARARNHGIALATKGQGRAVAAFEVIASTREPRVVLDPFPEAGRRGVFDAGAVRLETAAGEVVAERADPRPLFRTLRRQLRWDALDALYFAGYALWNYLTAPFLVAGPGFETRELEPRGGLRRLAIHFPDGVPTHSREQVMHFSGDGLLRRLDYTAEPFGGWARAANLCLEHREVGGIVFVARRRVVPRGPGGRPLPGPTLVGIALDELRVA